MLCSLISVKGNTVWASRKEHYFINFYQHFVPFCFVFSEHVTPNLTSWNLFGKLFNEILFHLWFQETVNRCQMFRESVKCRCTSVSVWIFWLLISGPASVEIEIFANFYYLLWFCFDTQIQGSIRLLSRGKYLKRKKTLE